MDSVKAHIPDNRHRMVLHNGWGIFLGEQVHGETLIRPSDGKMVPVRLVLEAHVLQDLGHIPGIEECLRDLPIKMWMCRAARKLSTELNVTDAEVLDIIRQEEANAGNLHGADGIGIADSGQTN